MRKIQFILLPFVALAGALGGSVVSGAAGACTGDYLGRQRERAGLVEYEDDSPAFLGPAGGIMGVIGGAIGGLIGAVVGWISKKAIWGALAGSLPLLLLIFYKDFCQVFDLSIINFSNCAPLLIALAIALSGPPLVGALAGRWAKFLHQRPACEQDEQRVFCSQT
jgi:hypothetical protein